MGASRCERKEDVLASYGEQRALLPWLTWRRYVNLGDCSHSYRWTKLQAGGLAWAWRVQRSFVGT